GSTTSGIWRRSGRSWGIGCERCNIMRRVIRNALTVASIAATTASVAIWIWSYSSPRFLLSNFFEGRFDDDRAWHGYYLVACRGQIACEFEQIQFTRRPTSAPSNRWAAEDSVELRTPALRAFPFAGTFAFHYSDVMATSSLGTLRVLQ